MDSIKGYLPVVLRYAIMAAMSALMTRGIIGSEQGAIITGSVDTIVGAIIALLTVAYALFKRPSEKAMEAAKKIDKQLPESADVIIKTPGAAPDIVVLADKALM